MPTVSAARGCSPTARIRRPIGVLNMHDPRRPGSRMSAIQIIRLRLPEDVAEERHAVEERRGGRSGSLGMSLGVPSAAVDVDEQVAGEAEREEVDRGPADDLVGAEVDRPDRVHERHGAPASDRDQQPEHPRVELVGAHDPEERAHQHHPLEADVHDAGALREHAAERREDERRREAEHRGEERRPDDDASRACRSLERVREVRDGEAEQRPSRSRTRRTGARRA